MSILSNEDWQFIDALDKKIASGGAEKHLRKNFESALGVEPDKRFRWAWEMLDNIPRAGYVTRGIPVDEAETVRLHVEQSVAIVNVAVEDKQDIRDIRKMLSAHDICEAITGDFHRASVVTRAEQERLEQIAARVIFETDPECMRPAFDEFAVGETLNARRAVDIERSQVLFRLATEYYQDYPHLRERFDELWDNWNNIPEHTDAGKILHEYACKIRRDNGFEPVAHAAVTAHAAPT